MRFLVFLILCTITFSAENSKKIEKVNLEGLISDHEIIYHINLLKNNSKENIDKIDKATIQAYVDLSGKGVGVHELDISIVGDDPKLSYVSKIKKIKVNIYKKDS